MQNGPLWIGSKQHESGGLRGREGGDHTQSASGGERKPWDVMNFSRNSESKQRQTEENRRKHTERINNRLVESSA